MEAALPARVISGLTIPTGLALASRLLRSGAMGEVAPLATAARAFIVIYTAAPGLSALRTTALVLGARLISGGAMGASTSFTATVSFAALTTTPGLPIATATTTLAMLATAMAAAGGEHLAQMPETSERAHHAGRSEYR